MKVWLMLPVLNFAETLVWLVKIVLAWSLSVSYTHLTLPTKA